MCDIAGFTGLLRARHYETIHADGRHCSDRVQAGTQRMSNLGAGFVPRYAANLLGVFHSLHAAADSSGVGVGLATAQRILRRHIERILVEAGGATIHFTIAKGQQ